MLPAFRPKERKRTALRLSAGSAASLARQAKTVSRRLRRTGPGTIGMRAMAAPGSSVSRERRIELWSRGDPKAGVLARVRRREPRRREPSHPRRLRVAATTGRRVRQVRCRPNHRRRRTKACRNPNRETVSPRRLRRPLPPRCVRSGPPLRKQIRREAALRRGSRAGSSSSWLPPSLSRKRDVRRDRSTGIGWLP